jgi:hypothetical protein
MHLQQSRDRCAGILFLRLLLIVCLAKSATGFATLGCPDGCYKGFMDNGGCPVVLGGHDPVTYIPDGCDTLCDGDGAVAFCCANGFASELTHSPCTPHL